MFNIKISKKEKIGLSIAVGLFVLVIIDRLVFSPISEKIHQINNDKNLTEKQLLLSLRNLNQKDLILREYEKYSSNLKIKGSDDEKTTSMLREIENLAKLSEVTLVDIKPQQPKNIDIYKEYVVSVRAEGSMSLLTSFFYKLSMSSNLLRVQNLHLELKEENSSVVQAQLQITKISVL